MSYIEELIREALMHDLAQSDADVAQALEEAVQCRIEEAKIDWHEMLTEAAMELVDVEDIFSAASDIAGEALEEC